MDSFFARRESWSATKHDILSRYLTAWSRKLGSRSNELAFVDLCAGAGQYDDGSLGSPLIAARVNDELRPHEKCLVIYACEGNQKTAARLRDGLCVELNSVPPLAHVFPVEFQDALPQILEMTRSVPTLIFLDPYGVRALSLKALRPILTGPNREPTEFLVRVPPMALARMAGWLKSNPARGARAQKVAAGCRTLLAQLGVSAELLEEAAAADDDQPGPGSDRLFRSYLYQLQGRFAYVNGFPIRSTYDGSPRYFLVHCTDHPDGALIMNEVASCVDDDLYDQSEREKAAGQFALFDNVREPRISVAHAASTLEGEMVMGRTYRYRDLRMLLVDRYGPEMRKKEHDRVVDRLVDEERIVRSPTDGRRDLSSYQRRLSPRPDRGTRPKSARPKSVRRP